MKWRCILARCILDYVLGFSNDTMKEAILEIS